VLLEDFAVLSVYALISLMEYHHAQMKMLKIKIVMKQLIISEMEDALMINIAEVKEFVQMVSVELLSQLVHQEKKELFVMKILTAMVLVDVEIH